MAKKVGSIEIDEKSMQDALNANADGGTYIGAEDPLLEFGQASSFVDEDGTGKRVTIKISNTGDEDKVVQLSDIIADCEATVLAEGTADGLTVKASPRKLDVLVNYLNKYPTRLRSIKLNVDEVGQLDEPLRYRMESPWKSFSEEERIPSSYQSQETNNPKMSEVADIKDWVISDQSTILYNVRAGRTVTLSILFGASIDVCGALNKKAKEAKKTVAIAYARSNA